ncbi:hypothetical protein BOTBODRAFT_580503 [Botryobasidium botryosum FD-172 SS1]|uniref:Uncharacterized protein n=1 Tax=Botryobasidium botryosum (strain FD-172 SS1) TaxID=930990 RepID=A0A067MSK5_BOTB1|nr:hypothetical protein BOTBODRAFT_580503 [Botryobasidium botryosum FD-172 SS1]
MAPKRPREANEGDDDMSSPDEPLALASGSVPARPTESQANFLGKEVALLGDALKGTVVKMGAVMRFYAEVKHEKIERHVSRIPQKLTNELGREVEQFDQICGAIEAQLLHALAILSRDLKRERAKLAPTAAPSEANSMDMDSNSPTTEGGGGPNTQETMNDLSQSTLVESRRPSATLLTPHTPPKGKGATTLKLDLSIDTLRGALRDPVASPVTLAPRTARPRNEPNHLSGQTHDFLPGLFTALAAQQAQQAATDAIVNAQALELMMDPKAAGNPTAAMGMSIFGPQRAGEIPGEDIDAAEVERLFMESNANGAGNGQQPAETSPRSNEAALRLFSALSSGNPSLFESFSASGPGATAAGEGGLSALVEGNAPGDANLLTNLAAAPTSLADGPQPHESALAKATNHTGSSAAAAAPNASTGDASIAENIDMEGMLSSIPGLPSLEGDSGSMPASLDLPDGIDLLGSNFFMPDAGGGELLGMDFGDLLSGVSDPVAPQAQGATADVGAKS